MPSDLTDRKIVFALIDEYFITFAQRLDEYPSALR
jgi:hypothetical protein